MRTLRTCLFILGGGAFVLFAGSCNDDDDNTIERYYERLGVISGTSESYEIILDSEDTLKPVNSFSSDYITDGNRVWVTFSVKSETDSNNYKVNVIGMEDVLTKSPVQLTAANADSIGSDPISVKSIWGAGKYINIDFSFRYSGDGITHLINLALDTTQAVTSDTVNLIFTQNANGDDETYTASSLVSFDISSLVESKSSLVLIIKATNYYDHTQKYKLKYTAGDNDSSDADVIE